MLPRLRPLLFALLALSANAARGQSLILNGSFEIGVNPPGNLTYRVLDTGATSTDLTGWTVSANSLAWMNGNFSGFVNNAFAPSNGVFMLDLTGINDNGSTFGGVQQNFATTIGAQYKVSFDLITGAGNSAGPVGATITAGPASQTFTTSSTDSTATTFTLNFTANAISTTLTIQGASTPPAGWYLGVDNVSVTAIPEPSTYAAFGGLTALIAGAIRRARRAATSRVSSAPC